MAKNAQWAAFISLLDIDGARTDWLGENARNLKMVMGKYMELRFGSSDVTLLADIVNSPAVVSAVSTSLTHVAGDDAAIKAAVAAVAG